MDSVKPVKRIKNGAENSSSEVFSSDAQLIEDNYGIGFTMELKSVQGGF